MNVIVLHPTDADAARDTVIEHIRQNPVFVMTAGEELYSYIPKLKLKEQIQSRMRICKQMKINVLLKTKENEQKFTVLSELLEAIDLEQGECEVVVLGDVNVSKEQETEVRCQLCALIQQLIYINIQLAQVHVCTEKESRDNEKIRMFERKINQHKVAVQNSIEHVDELEEDHKKYRTAILKKLKNIQSYIGETQNNELKIAVAATKKAGKSVIVNSMIGCEMAPTSLELATPNNCIYRKSPDEEYHLHYQKKNWNSPDSEEIRSRVEKLFVEAEQDYKNGLGIPDMEMEYHPHGQIGFSSYTIYDTPGPNLANATAHKEAAQRGVDAADVIVFTIDYSKYLTDDEYQYLKDVWTMCQEKGKKYSLILNVNKLDLRYDDTSDKSVVRIVDFIRNKLISTGKKDNIDFRNCVVIGTSALTYYNAMTIPYMKCPTDDGDCSCLLSDFSDKAMKRCINSYADTEDFPVEYEKRVVSALQQLRGMLDNAEVWHKQDIESVQDMEEFSGMPNLLSYVDYIANQKARNEKVNNLIFKIDSEYRAIMNFFHIEELMQRLKENQELLRKAIKILEDFKSAVENVLDPEYNDLYEEYKTLYSKYDNMKTVYLLELAQKRPIRLKDVETLYAGNVERSLSLDATLDEVTQNRINTLLSRRLKEEYENDLDRVLEIDAAAVTYQKILSEVCVTGMSEYMRARRDELGGELKDEQNGISATFTYIWSERLQKLRELVQQFSDRLTVECCEQLNIEIPAFQVTLGQSISAVDLQLKSLNVNHIGEIIKSAMKENNYAEYGAGGGILGFFRKVFGHASEKITLERLLSIYENAKLYEDLRTVYRKNGNLEAYLATQVRQPLKSDMHMFIADTEQETNQLQRNLNATTRQIEELIDDSKQYKENIAELEHEKRSVLNLKQAIQEFNTSWKEVLQS